MPDHWCGGEYQWNRKNNYRLADNWSGCACSRCNESEIAHLVALHAARKFRDIGIHTFPFLLNTHCFKPIFPSHKTPHILPSMSIYVSMRRPSTDFNVMTHAYDDNINFLYEFLRITKIERFATRHSFTHCQLRAWLSTTYSPFSFCSQLDFIMIYPELHIGA